MRYERLLGARYSVETEGLQRISWNRSSSDIRRPPSPATFSARPPERDRRRTTVRFKRDDRLTLEGSAEGALNGLSATAAAR